MDDHTLLLRPVEVAAALGMSKSKVYEMIASGVLPVVRIGRSVRVPRRALEKWIEAHISGRAACDSSCCTEAQDREA